MPRRETVRVPLEGRPKMTDFHAIWFFPAVISCGLVGIWGIATGLKKRQPGRFFFWTRSVAIGAMLVQIGAGVLLWQQGHRPGDGFHVFYGVVIAFTFSFAYIYRAQLSTPPGLGLRAVVVIRHGSRPAGVGQHRLSPIGRRLRCRRPPSATSRNFCGVPPARIHRSRRPRP